MWKIVSTILNHVLEYLLTYLHDDPKVLPLASLPPSWCDSGNVGDVMRWIFLQVTWSFESFLFCLLELHSNIYSWESDSIDVPEPQYIKLPSRTNMEIISVWYMFHHAWCRGFPPYQRFQIEFQKSEASELVYFHINNMVRQESHRNAGNCDLLESDAVDLTQNGLVEESFQNDCCSSLVTVIICPLESPPQVFLILNSWRRHLTRDPWHL